MFQAHVLALQEGAESKATTNADNRPILSKLLDWAEFKKLQQCIAACQLLCTDMQAGYMAHSRLTDRHCPGDVTCRLGTPCIASRYAATAIRMVQTELLR